MGRGKLVMELIAHKRSRHSTFYKRKKGLMKKLYEFTTLCDVDACMIVYGPYNDGRPMELDIWPQNLNEVRRIITKFKSKSGGKGKSHRNHDLSDFFEKRKNKIDDDIVKMQRANTKAMYPAWDNRIYHASLDQLEHILGALDKRIDSASNWSDLVMEDHQRSSMKSGAAPKVIGCTHNEPKPQSCPTNNNVNVHGLYKRTNMQLETSHHQLQNTRPLDFYMPKNYMLDQSHQTRPFDIDSSTTSPTFTMMMSDDYCLGSSSSTTNLQYTPLKPLMYYDPPTPHDLLENEMYMYNNNNYPSRMSGGGMEYYSPASMHQPVQPQYVQHPFMTSNSASQVMMPSAAPFQVNDDFNEVSDFQIANKRGRYY